MSVKGDNMRVNPNHGIVLNGGSGADEIFYEYDEKGRITKRKDSDGREEVYTYDMDGIATCTEKDGRVRKFDQSGNLVYCQCEDLEEWAEYNQFGKSTHYKEKSKEGIFEEWGEYNEAGLLTHLKDSEGYEEWWTYDSENRLLRREDAERYLVVNEYWENGNIRKSYRRIWSREEVRTSYNEMGLPVHSWSTDGTEEFWEYNPMGKETYHSVFSRKEFWKEYDKFGNLTHIKNSAGYEEWREHDSAGNPVHVRNNNGLEEWKDYNDSNQLVSYRNNRDVSYHNWYDLRGNLTSYEHCTNQTDEQYTYDENNHLIHFKRIKEKRDEM